MALRNDGHQILGVMDRDTFSDWSNWRASYDADMGYVERLIDQGLIHALAVGNEWDDGWAPGMSDDPNVAPRGGPSSWVMRFDDLGELLERTYNRLRVPGQNSTRVPLILGSMSSGQPAAMDTIDLSKVAGVQINPYGKAPSDDWPEPNWGTGAIHWLLDGIKERIQGRGLDGICRLIIGELGLNHYENSPERVAEWYMRMFSYLEQRGDIDSAFVFCDGDDNVDGYGQFGATNREYPSVVTVSQAMVRLNQSNDPIVHVEPDASAGSGGQTGPDHSPLSLMVADASDMKDDEYNAVLDLKPASLLVMCYAQWESDKGVADRVKSLVRLNAHTDLFVRFHADPDPITYASRIGGPRQWAQQCARRMEQYYGDLARDLGVRLHAILANEVDADYEGGLSPQQASAWFSVALSEYAALRPTDAVHIPAPTGAPSTHREFLQQFKDDGWVRPQYWIDGHGYDGDLANVCDVLESIFPDNYRMITETNDVDLTYAASLVGIRAHAICYFILNWAHGGEGRVQPPGRDDAQKHMSLMRFPDMYKRFHDTVGLGRVDDGNGGDNGSGGDGGGGTDNGHTTDDTGWWDADFSDEEITQAIMAGEPGLDHDVILQNVQTSWPHFGGYLKDASRSVKIAYIATIAVETGQFLPIPEYGNYNYFERMYGYQTDTGQRLGNLYVGDGARYCGRGFIQITGRNNYRIYGGILGVDLESDPEAALDPELAAGIMVTFFTTNNIPSQADLGNWETVRRRVNGGTTGWDRFMATINALVATQGGGGETHEDTAELLQKVLDEGAKYIGVPYVWDGETPTGFDCSGFISYCYRKVLGVVLTSFTDSIYDETDAVDTPLPGDIVLYEYLDESQPGVRFPHVGLVDTNPALTLDARGGVGVGYHAHVGGAVRYYRRARGLPTTSQEEADDMAWRDKFFSVISDIGDRVADILEGERAQLDDWSEPPKPPAKGNKATKAEWVAYGQAMQKWQQSVIANTDARYKNIGAVGQFLRDVRTQEVGPRPAF